MDQKPSELRISRMRLQQPTCAFRNHGNTTRQRHEFAPVLKTLLSGANFEVENQRFVVGAKAFAFPDSQAFDLGR